MPSSYWYNENHTVLKSWYTNVKSVWSVFHAENLKPASYPPYRGIIAKDVKRRHTQVHTLILNILPIGTGKCKSCLINIIGGCKVDINT